MNGSEVSGVHGVVDLDVRRRVVEGLQAGDVGELIFQELLDTVDGELPLGGKDVDVAGERQVLVLVGGEDATLEVHDQAMGGEKISTQDRLVDVRNLKIPREAAPRELEGDDPGPVAVDPGAAGSDQVVLRGVEGWRRFLGKTLVEAPVLTSIGTRESSSVNHSRRAGARSAARGGFRGWNGAKTAEDGGVGARPFSEVCCVWKKLSILQKFHLKL